MEGDALLVVKLLHHVANGVRWLDVEGDGLAGQSLDEELRDDAANKEDGRPLDDVVFAPASAFELLPREDEALLVRGDSQLAVDLLLRVVDGTVGVVAQRRDEVP